MYTVLLFFGTASPNLSHLPDKFGHSLRTALPQSGERDDEAKYLFYASSPLMGSYYVALGYLVKPNSSGKREGELEVALASSTC